MRKFIVIPYERFMAQSQGDKVKPLHVNKESMLDNKQLTMKHIDASTSRQPKQAPVRPQRKSSGVRKRRTVLPPRPPTVMRDVNRLTKDVGVPWLRF